MKRYANKEVNYAGKIVVYQDYEIHKGLCIHRSRQRNLTVNYYRTNIARYLVHKLKNCIKYRKNMNS